MRSRSIPGLILRLARLHPKTSLGLGAAFAATFVAGWLAAPRVAPQAPPAAPVATHPEGARDAIVVRAHDGLPQGAHVRVLARALEATATTDGYVARPVLVERDGATRWVPGDVVAVRRAPDLGYLEQRADFDGDGEPEELWLATSRRAYGEDGRAELQGWLVFDSAEGIASHPVASRDDWGNSERVLGTRVLDLVDGPAPDLAVLLDTTVCEVGRGGRLVRVFSFEGGEPRMVLEHYVHDPVDTGLAQSRVGYLELEDGVLHARTLVFQADDGASRVWVREQTWTRAPTGGFSERVAHVPARATDGRIIQAVRGRMPGLDDDWDVPAYAVAAPDGGRGHWVSQATFADPHFEAAFLSEEERPYLDWASLY